MGEEEIFIFHAPSCYFLINFNLTLFIILNYHAIIYNIRGIISFIIR